MPPETRTLSDAVCLGCACLCDDVRLTIAGRRVESVEGGCPEAAGWFTQPIVPAEDACFITGQPASLAEATAAAAELLTAERSPVVAGLAGVSVEAQRLAVAIADRIGGGVVGGDTAGDGAALAQAVASHGAVTATLGEAAQRADRIVFWRCDPAATHPRHFDRFSLQPTSEWLPRGRADRTVYAIGSPNTRTAAAADHVIPLEPERDYEAFAVLHALAQGVALDPAAVRVATGVELAEWRRLADALAGGRYAAVFYDELSSALSDNRRTTTGAASLGALTNWLAELQATTRAAALPLGARRYRSNAVGASNVLAWQTGFAGDVDCSRGYPRPIEVPIAGAGTLLAVSAEAVGDTHFDAGKRVLLAATPAGPDAGHDADAATRADVLFRVAPPGFAERGSAYRSDGVALPLREPWATDALSAEAVLRSLWQQLDPRAGGVSGAEPVTQE